MKSLLRNTTKFEIVEAISKSTKITRQDTKLVVDGVFDQIVKALEKGNRVELRGFGVFIPRKREARIARNPKSGESVSLGDRYVPVFKASTDFTKRVTDRLTGKVDIPTPEPEVSVPVVEEQPKTMESIANSLGF